MYNTSKGYKEKILEDSTQHELNIYIDGNKIEPNHIIDFSSKSELFNNNELCLGCTPEKDIEFEIDKRDLPENYNEVYVETGIKYHNDIVTEGEEITLKEEKEIPLNLEISGNHKQEIYSGKNMYPLPNEQTINGIKVSHNKDGTFNLIGTATAETFIPVSTTNILNDKKVYTISKNTTNIGMAGYEYNINTWLQTFVSIGKSEKSKTFTYNKNSNMTRNVLQINIANGTVLNETNIKIMLKENSNETEWEPYVGGIPAPNPDYPSEIKTTGSNVNLFDITKYDYRNLAGANIQINNKTDFRVNATMNNNANCAIGFKIMDLTKYAGKILTVKSYVKSSTSTNKAFLVLRQNNSDYTGTKTNELFDESQNTTNGVITLKYKVTDTINDSNRYLFIWFYANRGTTCNIGDYIDYKVKLVAGTEIGEYSKYGQGAVKVTKCNKNIFDGKLELGRWSFSTGNAQEYANYVRSKNAILVKPNTIYTASCDVSGLTLSFTQFDENMNFINALPNQQATYKNCKYIKININDTTNVDLKVQLEEGSTATTYEPHQEQSYIIPVQQEMLEGDYFDWVNKEEVHVWEKLVFKGNENWNLDDIYNGIAQFSLSVNAVNINDYDTVIRTMSNYFKGVGFDSSWLIDNCVTIRKHSRVRIMISKYTTIEQFKTWLKSKYDEGTPVIVYYKLAMPTRLPFTEEQKEIAKELRYATTYEGTTHICSTDSISPILKTTCGSEIVPIGKFTIQKPIEDDEFKVKIKATDYMKKFEDNKYDGSNLTYPKTMVEVLKDICIKVGVELGSTSFLNSDKQIAVYDNTVTARTYLGYIAEQAGGFAVIGRDGKLYIKTFGEDTINFNVDLFGDFTWGDRLKVSRVSYEDGIQNYKFGDEIQATVFIDQNNMYIVDSEQVENIYNQIKDFEVYTFEGETIIDPAYDIGDILVIDGKKVLYQGEIKYAGKFKASINNKVQAKTEQESMQTKQTNSNKIKRVQSEINQIDGKITQLVQETTENEEKITQAQQDIDGFTQKVATKDELTEKVNELKHTIEGITLQAKETGGGNIFFYAKEYWRGQTQDSEATLEEYTNTLIQQNNVSDEGYLINNGVSIQSQIVKNGQYVISFNYYKLKSNATGYVKINEVEYKLDGETNNWIEKIIPVEITSNNIKIEIGSDTVASYYISDLMVSMGVEKNIWTQNANETRTDTVEIGKGIQVNSSTKNTYTRIDADGNRTFNSSTNERVAEMTDKGVYTKQLEVKEQAKINVLLIQQIGSQVWLTGLGG